MLPYVFLFLVGTLFIVVDVVDVLLAVVLVVVGLFVVVYSINELKTVNNNFSFS